MAKVIKNGEPVECAVLHENAGQYIVKFKTGAVRGINKNRVYDLDSIDEGVLDTIRSTVNKYGRKVISAAKDVADKVKSFFVHIFTVDNFVFFKNDNGEILNVSHPINAIEGAKESGRVNFVPSNSVVDVCNDVGIKPEAVENFTYDSEYTGAFQFTDLVGESYEYSNSLLTALFEDSKRRLKSNEKINLHGTFKDKSQEELVNIIVNEYMSRFDGNMPKTDPLLIWGAPGIGKTSIIRSISDECKKYNGGMGISIISINGGNIGPDDFTMPATISKFIRRNKQEELDSGDAFDVNKNFRGSLETVIKDLPKSWLPVYDPDADNADELNAIANGGSVDASGNITDGPGGIFFIDEYSRLSQSGMDALMQTPTTRDIGSNSTLHFGDRWVIVCAANRQEDMSNIGSRDALLFEGASKTRFNHCNFVPDPRDWFEWANKPSKRRKGRTNILKDIILYLEKDVREHPDTFGDFYEMYLHKDGKLNGAMGTACPRTWEALSEFLIDNRLDNYAGQKYKSISEIPVKTLVDDAAGIVGGDVAERFAEFVSEFSVFKSKDAENVWTKGDDCQYDVIKQRKLNSSNVEEYFTNCIFPKLMTNYPGGFDGTVSPDAALNFMKFLEACCYDNGAFCLNRFNTIMAAFSKEFNVDMRSVNGPYADAANFAEEVVNKHQLA